MFNNSVKKARCLVAIIYQEFKNGHFLSMDQHVGKEKTRIQLEAAKPRKQPRKYSEKFNTDAF